MKKKVDKKLKKAVNKEVKNKMKKKMKKKIKKEVKKIKKVLTPKFVKKLKQRRSSKKSKKSSDGEMKYHQGNKKKLLPLGQSGDGLTHKWTKYNQMLCTSKWQPIFDKVKIYKKQGKGHLEPEAANGVSYTVGVENFDSVRRVLPPDNINIRYITDLLNQNKSDGFSTEASKLNICFIFGKDIRKEKESVAF